MGPGMSFYFYVFVLAVLEFVFIHDVQGINNEPELRYYNPFPAKRRHHHHFGFGRSQPQQSNNEYTPKATWNHFSDDTLTASVADFKLQNSILKQQKKSTSSVDDKPKKVRLVVFSARGAVLHHLQASSDPVDMFSNLMLIDGTLWYFSFSPEVMVRQESDGDRFLVMSRMRVSLEEIRKNGLDHSQFCKKVLYTVKPDSKKAEKISDDKVTPDDPDCKLIFTGPPQLFTGKMSFPKSLSWDEPKRGINHLEEPLGLKIEEETKTLCYRDVVIYSYARPIASFKLDCGHVSGLVVANRALYYDSNFVVEASEDANFFTVLTNSRNGECIRRTYKFKGLSRGRVTTKIYYQPDHDCEVFLEGRASERQIVPAWTNSLKEQIARNEIDVVPIYMDTAGEGPKPLNQFTAGEHWLDVNMGKDLGAVVLRHANGNDWVVLLVTKGVVIDAAFVNSFPNIVVRKDVLFCDQYLMFRKVPEESKYTVVVKHASPYCTRTTYTVVERDGKWHKKQVFPSEIGVDDSDCQGLLSGDYLQNPDAEKYGVVKRDKKNNNYNPPFFKYDYINNEKEITEYLL